MVISRFLSVERLSSQAIYALVVPHLFLSPLTVTCCICSSNSSFGNLNLPHRAVIPKETIHHNGHSSPLRIQSELDHDQLTPFDTLLIDRSRCSPAPPPVPRPPWSPAEASTLPVLVSLLLTITPRVPTATCLSTLARRASLSATGASLPPVSSLPSALLVSLAGPHVFFLLLGWENTMC